MQKICFFDFIYLFIFRFILYQACYICASMMIFILWLRALGTVNSQQPKAKMLIIFSHIFTYYIHSICYNLHVYRNWCSLFSCVFCFYTLLIFINQQRRQMILNDDFEFKGSPVIFVAQSVDLLPFLRSSQWKFFWCEKSNN